MLKDRIKSLFIFIICIIAYDGFTYYKTGTLSSATIKNDIFFIGVYLITSLIIYAISRRNE